MVLAVIDEEVVRASRSGADRCSEYVLVIGMLLGAVVVLGDQFHEIGTDRARQQRLLAREVAVHRGT